MYSVYIQIKLSFTDKYGSQIYFNTSIYLHVLTSILCFLIAHVIKYTMTWAPLSTCTSYFLLWLSLVSTLENRLKIIRKGGNNHIQVFLQFVNTFFIYSNVIIYSKSLEAKMLKSIWLFINKYSAKICTCTAYQVFFCW